MKVIYVEWLDASSARGPLWGKKATEYPAMVVKSAGILVGEDETVVRMCLDQWIDKDDDSQAYRDIAAIPKILIQRRLEWEIPCEQMP